MEISLAPGVKITASELQKHLLISGGTGFGKSECNSIIFVQLAEHGQGFFAVDKDSKTVQDTLSRLSEYGLDDKVIFLRPSLDSTFGYDPFHTELTGREYEAWLHRQVQMIGRAIGRVLGLPDFKEQPRRARCLKHVLFFVGTNVKGKHLGLHRALDVLDIGGKAWNRWYEKVKHHLPRPTFVYWEDMIRKSPRDRFFFTESTINLFESFLSPLVSATLSAKHSINFREAVRENKIILADLGETPYFSEQQGDAFGALLINGVMDACYFEKKRYFISVEEAETILGEDFGDWLARGRKRGAGLILTIQDISSLKNQQTDISAKALSQPYTHISFNHKDEDSLDALAQIHGIGQLDFSQLWKPQQLQDGYDWHLVPEESYSSGANWSATNGKSKAKGTAIDKKITASSSEGENSQESVKYSKTKNESATKGMVVGEDHLNLNDSITDGNAETSGRDKGKGKNSENGLSAGFGETLTDTDTDSNSSTLGGSSSRSVSYRNMPLARYKTHWFPSGLVYTVEEQLWMFKKALRTLDIAQCMVTIGSRTALAQVHTIDEPFEGDLEIRQIYKKMLIRRNHRQYPFFFSVEDTSCPSVEYRSRKETDDSSDD